MEEVDLVGGQRWWFLAHLKVRKFWRVFVCFMEACRGGELSVQVE